MRSLEKLEEKYPELITPDSPTQRIGAPLEGGFKTVSHGEKMLSLQDAFDYGELRIFWTGCIRIWVWPKMKSNLYVSSK